jgi:hypothetical protein
MADYELWLTRDNGQRIGLLNTVSNFEYAIKYDDDGMGYGLFTVKADMDLSLLGLLLGYPDRRIEVWRGTAYARKRLEQIIFIRYARVSTGEDGVHFYEFGGPDATDLLKRRVVWWRATTTATDKTDYADDMMKAFVTENLGTGVAAAQSTREITNWGFTVQADSSSGPEVSIAGTQGRQISDVLMEIADSAKENDTRVYFRVVPVTRTAFEFRTWVDQIGKDRTSGNEKLTFSLARGNIKNPMLELDYNDEINAVLMLGLGPSDYSRYTQSVIDQTRIDASAVNRREGFYDAGDLGSKMIPGDMVSAIAAAGHRYLNENDALKMFGADILDTPSTRYGLHWNIGDRVLVDYAGMQFTCLIASAHFFIDQDGLETITARFERQT